MEIALSLAQYCFKSKGMNSSDGRQPWLATEFVINAWQMIHVDHVSMTINQLSTSTRTRSGSYHKKNRISSHLEVVYPALAVFDRSSAANNLSSKNTNDCDGT